MTGTNNTAILATTMAVALGALITLSVRADTIVVDDQVMVRKSEIARPARGMTMTAVEAKFGSPSERHATVGTPPITRWDYGQFAVFFEKDRVIDAVVTASESSSTQAAGSSAAPAAPAAAAPDASPASASDSSAAPTTSEPSASQAPESTSSAAPAPAPVSASVPAPAS